MKKLNVIDLDQIQSSANVPAGTNVDVVTIKGPVDLWSIIDSMSTYTMVQEAWSHLTWNFRVNGINVVQFNGQKDQIGLQYSPMILGKPIEVPPGGTFTLNVENDDLVDYVAGGLMTVKYGTKV